MDAKTDKRLKPDVFDDATQTNKEIIFGRFVAEQVAAKRVCTIRYVCEFLDVSRDWLVKNIMPNVYSWKFLDRYLLPYHKVLDKNVKFTRAKMHDLIDIKYAEREEDTVMKKFDNGRILFSIEEVIEYINNNCKCSRQTAQIDIYDLMSPNEIDELNSDIKVKEKQEIIDDVLQRNNTEELNPQQRNRTPINKKKIKHIGVDFDLTKINVEKLKDNLLTPKQIHKLTEMSYRHAFRNCYIKIEFNSDKKTWFYPTKHYFENNAQNYYPILISYEDFLQLKGKKLLKM